MRGAARGTHCAFTWLAPRKRLNCRQLLHAVAQSLSTGGHDDGTVMAETGVDLRLLLVEDDAGYAGFIGATLMSVGSANFEYDHVTSIRAAVERLMISLRPRITGPRPPRCRRSGGSDHRCRTAPDLPVRHPESAPKTKRSHSAPSRPAPRTICRKATRQETCSHAASDMRSSGSTPSCRSSGSRTATA